MMDCLLITGRMGHCLNLCVHCFVYWAMWQMNFSVCLSVSLFVANFLLVIFQRQSGTVWSNDGLISRMSGLAYGIFFSFQFFL